MSDSAVRGTREQEIRSTAERQRGQARWTEQMDKLLDQWRRRVWAAQVAHYRKAGSMKRRNVALGVPVVVLTAVVGTSLFSTINVDKLPTSLRLVIGVISVVAAILAALQNFFSFAQLADKHVLAADWYGALRRKIEMMQALPPEARGDPIRVLDGIRKEMNEVTSQFPNIGQDEWVRVATKFGVREPTVDLSRPDRGMQPAPAAPPPA